MQTEFNIIIISTPHLIINSMQPQSKFQGVFQEIWQTWPLNFCGMSKDHDWLGLVLSKLFHTIAHMENDHVWTHTVLQEEASSWKPSAQNTTCPLCPSADPKSDQLIRKPGKPVAQCDTSLRICSETTVTGEGQEPEMKDAVYKAAAVLQTRDREGTEEAAWSHPRHREKLCVTEKALPVIGERKKYSMHSHLGNWLSPQRWQNNLPPYTGNIPDGLKTLLL